MILSDAVTEAQRAIDAEPSREVTYNAGFRDGVKWLLELLYECDDLEIDVDE